MISKHRILFTVLCVFSFYPLFAGGIRGTVAADNGSPLPFASIFVMQTGSGAATNENGFYEINLSAGSYEIVYQYMGYESQVRQVEVVNGFVEINIVLKSEVLIAEEVEVIAGREGEDPAYTIMRKAIAKAKYHTQVVDKFSARVYIKGALQIKDYPWLFKKKLGDIKDKAFATESVSEIRYTRPNTFEEKVISIHSVGKDNNTSPNRFIFNSFYQPEVGEAVSPLSPEAFSYYRFEYLGTFQDRSYQVSRIKVIPRSKGENVFEGIINIVDDWWSIHSLDMKTTTQMGIDFGIKTQYAPIEDKVWLPVSHQFKVNAEFLGFEVEYNYLATLSDYQITMNPELYVEKMEIIDEKLEKTLAKEAEKKYRKKDQQLKERIASGKAISRKELNKMLKDYEKQEIKKQKEPEVIANTTYKIDSLSYKKNDAYWDSIRPVPLTPAELKTFKVINSVATIKGDTVKKSKHRFLISKKGFQPLDIILGDNYKVSKHSNLRLHTPILLFNTVEGINLAYRITFGTELQDRNKTNFNISPVFRYAFSREKFSGFLTTGLNNKKYRLELSGGRYIRQFNQDEPIWPVVNTFTTLFLEKNLMKLYERDFVNLLYNRKLNPYIILNTNWSWMRRYQLFNSSDYKLINRRNVEYDPNAPVNKELIDTGFPTHEAFIGSIDITIRPWLKYKVDNGNKIEIPGSSPAFSLNYRKGFDHILGSDVHFDQLELNVKHTFDAGILGKADLALCGGMFLNNDKMYFMDYKHFQGNRTPFATSDPAGSFRLLDYYKYSTSDKYFVANVYYHFRKLLLTTSPLVRLAGINENIFVNYLASPTSGNYTEVGYSIDGISRIFRLEAAVAFQNGRYLYSGLRIGIATYIGTNFSGN